MAIIIDLEPFKVPIENMYSDEIDIWSTTEIEQPDGSINNDYPVDPQQRKIPCRVRIFLSNEIIPGEYTETHNIIREVYTIFCSNSTDLKTGDRMELRRMLQDGTVYFTTRGTVSTVGTNGAWETHKELKVLFEGDA